MKIVGAKAADLHKDTQLLLISGRGGGFSWRVPLRACLRGP